jgi:hypothetical protein
MDAITQKKNTKVKLSLWLIKHNAMKTYWVVERACDWVRYRDAAPSRSSISWPFSPNTFVQKRRNVHVEISSNTCPRRYEFAVHYSFIIEKC